MRRMLVSEYDNTHSDFRGIWNTERPNESDWADVRHLYMGKRTIMAGDGKCTLLIEGLSLALYEDADYERHLLHVDTTGAVVFVRRNLSSHAWGQVLKAAARRLGDESTTILGTCLLPLRHSVVGIWYATELVSAAGVVADVVRLPHNTAGDMRYATDKLRRLLDVVRIREITIANEVDLQPELDVIMANDTTL